LTNSNCTFKAPSGQSLRECLAIFMKRRSTAARSGEVIGARWTEFNLEERIWIVPPERMKPGKEHRVPLRRQAVELLRALHREHRFVLSAQRRARLSARMRCSAFGKLLRADGATVHGF
jgi:integrase